MPTQLDVIKKFMAALNEHGFTPDKTSSDSDTALSTAMLDKAIQACSQYKGIQDAMEKFIAAAESNDSATFLSQCGIILGNADVGGITGSDTGISTVAKTSDTTVLEIANTYTAEDTAAQIIRTGTDSWIVTATSYADTINSAGEDSVNAGSGDDVIIVSGRKASIVTGGNSDTVSVSGNDVKAFVIKDYNSDTTVVQNVSDFNVTISGSTAAYYKTGYESLIGGFTAATDSGNFIDDYDDEEEENVAARVAIDSIPAEAYPSETTVTSVINALKSSPVAVNSADTLTVNLSDVDTVNGYFYKTGTSTTEFSSTNEGTTGLAGMASSSFDTSWLDVDSDGKLSFTYRGLKVNIKGFRSGETLTTAITKDNIGSLDAKYQDIIIENLYKWWEKAALDLNKLATGIDFLTEGVTTNEIDLYFETNNNNVLAYVQSSNISAEGKTRHLDLVVNSKYYNSLSNADDPNGMGSSTTALDRTLAHEFNHAILSANVDYFHNLPMFIKEGMAEVIHGIDDERYGTIVTLAGNSKSLAKYIDLSITSSSQVSSGESGYPYAGGYMFLRWLAKTASESDAIPLGEITANVNLDGEGIYCVSGDSTLETAKVSYETDTGVAVGTLSGDTYTANSAVKQHITDSGSTARTYASIGSEFTVDGGSDNDKITVSGGNSSINGGGGNDTIKVDGKYNTVNGGEGNDSINSTAGYVTILGGAGSDTVVQNVNVNYDYIDLGDGVDIFDNLSGRDDNYITYGNTIIGGAGNDTVKTIYAYNYSIDGGDGNNLFSIASGNSNTILAGSGNDSLRFQFTNNYTYFIDIGDGANDLQILGTYSTVKSGIGNDTATVNGTNNSVDLGNGTDQATIGIYSNAIASVNTISTGDGNDTVLLYAYSNGNTIELGAGNDSVQVLSQSDTIITGSGSDTLLIGNYNNIKDVSFTVTDFDENDTFNFVNNISTYTFDTDTKVLTAGNAKVSLPNLKIAEETLAWSVNGTTATYNNTVTGKQFNLSNNKITLKDTSDSKTLITITGLKSGLSPVDGAIAGITIDGTTVKLAKSVLGTSDITISDGYTLAFDGEVDTPKVTAAAWTLDNTTATYKSESTTAGYTLASDGKSISYTQAGGGETLVTITGVKSTDGLKLENTTVTVDTASLNKTDVTISNDYTLKLADGISSPSTTAAHFDGLTYKSASTSAGYTLADNQITYTAAVAATNLFTLTGVKSTDGITVSDTTVTITAANLNQENVTIDNSTYELELAQGISSPSTTAAHFDGLTYKSASTSAGYTLADNQITYTAAVAATDLFTLTGVKSTDGITVDGTTVTITAANLNQENVTIDNSTYKLELAQGISSPSTTAAHFDGLTYKSSSTSAGYTLSNNQIKYTAEVAATDLFTLTGVKSTDGITVSDTTVTITAANLNQENVTIDNSTYSLQLDDDVTKSETKTAGWAVDGTAATYKSAGTTQGYSLSNNQITYSAGNIETFTVSGLKSGLTPVDGAIDGISVNEKTVTLSESVLDTASTVSITEGYTLKLADSVTRPVNSDAKFGDIVNNSVRYESAGTSAGYVLSNNQISYQYAQGSGTVFTLTGIKDTSDITVANNTVTLTSDAIVAQTNVMLTNETGYSYTLVLGTGIAEPSVETAAGWTLDNTNATYKSASTTAGYTLNDSKTTLTYNSASGGETLVTVTGVKSTDGLKLENKTVTVDTASLNKTDVTISNDYTLKLADGISSPSTTAAHFDGLTYKSSSTSAGYTLADNQITYTAAVAATNLFTLTGVKSTDGITVSDTTVTITAANLNQENVTISNSDYKLALANDVTKSTTTAASWTLDATTATYKSEGKTSGYTLADNQITYSSAFEGNTLVTVTGVKSTDGLKLENTTITVDSASLNETNVTISEGYTLQLADNVKAPNYTGAGFTTVSGNSSTYQTANNTAGYTLENNQIKYTAAVAANNLVTVSNITSTDGLTFDSTTNVLTIANNFADVATVTNDSSNNITVTNGTYNLTLAAKSSLIACANWSYQNSILYIDNSSLTNVGGITDSTTGISLSDGTLTLPNSVTVNVQGTNNPSVVTGDITQVMVGNTPYNVENNYLVLAVTDFDVRKIEFDGTTMTLFNVDGQKIPESKITKSDYATANNGILTIQSLGKSSNITVSNTGLENFKVTDSSFIAGLASGGTINGIGGSLTGSESWLYSDTTLTSSTVTLTEVEGITTASGVTISGNSVTLEGAGISYNGTTLSSGSMVATSSDVTLNDGAVATLTSGSSVKFADSATVTLNKLEIVSTSNGTATQTSTSTTLGGNVTYGGLTLTSGTMNVADGITLNNGAVATGNSSTAEINLNVENSATINGYEISATDTAITAVYDTGIKFTPNTGAVTYNGMTFSGGTAEITSDSVTLSNGAIITNADDKNFVVNTAATVTIDGKTFKATGESAVVLTSTSNGFKVGDESFEVNGDADYTVAAAYDDIQTLSGISSDATVTTANATLDVVTDSAGKFTVDDRVVTISGDNSVIFGVEDDTVKSLSSLEGAVIGNFNNPLTIDGGRVELLGDENISVTASGNGVTRIEGIGADNGVTISSAGGASIVSADTNGIFQFGTSQKFNVTDSDNAVTFATSNIDSLNTPSVTGISEVENGVIALNTDGALIVNSEKITISGIESDVTLTTAAGTINGVAGLNGLINGLSGNATVGIIDSDVTINSAAVQISEVGRTTLSANLDGGKLTEIQGLNNLATVTTAKNVSIETAEQGTFNFPNGIYHISGDENVIFVTDANSRVKNIGELSGTFTSNQNNVTINSAALYTSNTDASVISAGVGIGTVRGLASSDTVTAPTDTSVVMPSESVLNINGVNYNLTGDNDGIIITGNTIGGLAADARLTIGAANSYVVNNTSLKAKAGDIIIGDPEGTAHIYAPTDINFTSDTTIEEVLEKITNNSDSEKITETDSEKAVTNGNLSVIISNTDTSTTQTSDFSGTTGVKKVTLQYGEQTVTFNNEGGNIAVVEDGSTGNKTINLGNGGDIAVIGNTESPVNVKAGRGKDQIVSSAMNLAVDLTAGGATKITATRGTVQLTGYNAATGAGIQTTNSYITAAIRNNVIQLDNGTIRYGSTSINIDSNAETEGSNIMNFYNLKGERTKVAFTYSGGGTVNQSESKENLLMVSKGNSSLTGGSGNDVAIGGAGDTFDLGAGNNSIELDGNRNTGETSTIAQTATSGRTQVSGFKFGFGDSGDRIRIDVSRATVSYRNGQLTFGYMNAQLILNNASSADVAESADVGDEGSSQKVLVNDGVKLEVAEENTAIRVSSDSEERATAYVGDNSGINLSDVDENVGINLNDGTGTFGGDSVTFRGINKLQGGTGINTLIGSADENNTIVAGAGQTSMWGAGAGNDWLVGSTSTVKSGSTSFFFADGDGHDTITNFEFLTSENKNTADKVETYGSIMTGAKVSGNDVIIEFSNIDDRLTIKEGRGKNIQINDNLVAQVNVDSLNYDGQANYFMATGKNATVSVNESLTSAEIWMNGGSFAGDIKYLNASSLDGKATLAGNTVDNVITAAQGDSSMWGAGSSNDTLIGGNGADMFWYGLTDGHDVIQNATGDDVINLYDMTIEDVASANVTASAIQINTTTGNSLTVESRNSGVGFRLLDGTTWTINQNTREWAQRS